MSDTATRPTIFALLEHDTTAPTCPPPPGRDVHYDLIIEVHNAERLPTWRLARNPLDAPGDIPAQRIADHRHAYLNYEGPVSNNRGFVRRIDHGPVHVDQLVGDELVARLSGDRLNGTYEITLGRGGRLMFRLARNHK